MNFSSLPMLNAIGCLFLAGVVFTQWAKESRDADAATQLRSELAAAQDSAKTEKRHSDTLERDIAVLKQSFEATRLAAAKAQKSSAATVMESQLATATEQVETWKNSLADRDSRIRELENDLIATRRRLDEAIVRIKQAEVR
ncbi:hypothetical protein JIN84_07465 [Luteolibacter yonseiensis]|uniref:Uncharacterized protein n=1 Tax=Luteolibacter yonseiensis TaxID=1144680 RepID=A0A934R360_9BACT|nr:hypothetical protein [Luteolibacter yonseiensis]MBK1815446.1 hypothetical protein [Luteolibacter yonseiensis]